MNTSIHKKKLFWILVTGFIFFLVSCNLNPGDDNTSGDEDASKYLGKGYDIFDPYADSTQVKDYILDVDTLKKDDMIELTDENNSTTYSRSGKTIKNYLASFNVSAGVSADYKLFSGTLSAKFGSATYSSNTTAFATYTSTVRKYKEKVLNQYNNPEILRNYVIPDVRQALDNCESENDALNFFAAYGTHVILWDYLGARVDFHGTTESSDYTSATDFATDLEVAFTGLSTDETYRTTISYSNFSSKSSRQLRVYGGPSEYANSILMGDYSTWEEGVGDESTKFQYFNQPLKPGLTIKKFRNRIRLRRRPITLSSPWIMSNAISVMRKMIIRQSSRDN